jgi:hypothetical protein
MWEDPIVAEVHRIREEIAARYKFDMAAYFADVQRRQVALGDRLVLQPIPAERDAEPDRGGTNGTSVSTSRRPPRQVP